MTDRDFARPLTLDTLAGAANLSKFHFARAFAAAYGETVGPNGQPDLNILLARPAPPMFSEEDAEALRSLVAKGAMAGGVIETDDCRRTYEELKSRGVTFLQEPAQRPYGIEALFRDDSGNWFSLTQRPESD